MQLRYGLAGVLACLLLAGCGVPRAALEQARVGAVVTKGVPTDETGVREALRRQAPRWEAFAQTLRQRELGGVLWVEEGFVDLVERTAALARRQVELMDAGEDQAELNRAVLTEMAGLWEEARRYLGQ